MFLLLSGKKSTYYTYLFYTFSNEYNDVIKIRIAGSSEAEISICLYSCLSKDVKSKFTSDCKSQEAILPVLDKLYGTKDRVINQIIDDIMDMQGTACTSLYLYRQYGKFMIY